MFWSPFTTWGWSSYTPRLRVQVLVALYDLGVVQLYPQAPGTSSGRLLRPGGGPAVLPGTRYKFWSPFTTWGWFSCTPRHRVQVLVAFYDLHGLQMDLFSLVITSGRLTTHLPLIPTSRVNQATPPLVYTRCMMFIGLHYLHGHHVTVLKTSMELVFALNH